MCSRRSLEAVNQVRAAVGLEPVLGSDSISETMNELEAALIASDGRPGRP
jgi:hypothetical protein